jgi:inorganic pyrophosphatase
VPGGVIDVRPIGALRLVDDAGGDEKVLAVPVPRLTKRYELVINYTNYTDPPRVALEQVQHFFEHYKDLQPGKWVKTGGWADAAQAQRRIREAIDRARIGGKPWPAPAQRHRPFAGKVPRCRCQPRLLPLNE